MTKKWFLWIFCVLFSVTFSQERTNHYQTKKILVTKDTIFLESVSINPAFFSIKDKNQKKIDSRRLPPRKRKMSRDLFDGIYLKKLN